MDHARPQYYPSTGSTGQGGVWRGRNNWGRAPRFCTNNRGNYSGRFPNRGPTGQGGFGVAQSQQDFQVRGRRLQRRTTWTGRGSSPNWRFQDRNNNREMSINVPPAPDTTDQTQNAVELQLLNGEEQERKSLSINNSTGIEVSPPDSEVEKAEVGLASLSLSRSTQSDSEGALSPRKRRMSEEKGGGDLGNKGYFCVGSHIKCRYGGSQMNQVEGEVAAFHNSSRLLVIRAPASNGKANSSNVYLINADCVDKISVDDRAPGDGLRPIDFRKLGKRREKSIGTKQARIRALAADVSPAGRKLFLSITKTIDEVAWDGDAIVVLGEVRISPPYTVEEVKGDKEASVVHVKKIVEKHWKDQVSTTTAT